MRTATLFIAGRGQQKLLFKGVNGAFMCFYTFLHLKAGKGREGDGKQGTRIEGNKAKDKSF